MLFLRHLRIFRNIARCDKRQEFQMIISTTSSLDMILQSIILNSERCLPSMYQIVSCGFLLASPAFLCSLARKCSRVRRQLRISERNKSQQKICRISVWSGFFPGRERERERGGARERGRDRERERERGRRKAWREKGMEGEREEKGGGERGGGQGQIKGNINCPEQTQFCVCLSSS